MLQYTYRLLINAALQSDAPLITIFPHSTNHIYTFQQQPKSLQNSRSSFHDHKNFFSLFTASFHSSHCITFFFRQSLYRDYLCPNNNMATAWLQLAEKFHICLSLPVLLHESRLTGLLQASESIKILFVVPLVFRNVDLVILSCSAKTQTHNLRMFIHVTRCRFLLYVHWKESMCSATN